jgi:hypothetical protein
LLPSLFLEAKKVRQPNPGTRFPRNVNNLDACASQQFFDDD